MYLKLETWDLIQAVNVIIHAQKIYIIGKIWGSVTMKDNEGASRMTLDSKLTSVSSRQERPQQAWKSRTV